MLEKKNCFNCNNAKPIEIQDTTCICKAGKGTKIFARPSVVFVDTTRPWLIDIGENVQIVLRFVLAARGCPLGVADERQRAAVDRIDFVKCVVVDGAPDAAD